MSSAVLEAPSLFTSPRAAGGVGGRRVTLEERLEAAWRSAQRDGVSECPLCRADMRAEAASARCRGCGSVIS